MGQNEEELAPEPGWGMGAEELFESRSPEMPAPPPPSPPPRSRPSTTDEAKSPPSPPSSPAAPPTVPPSSSPVSSSSALAEVFAEILKAVAAGASIVFRRRGVPLDLKMTAREASALARPIAQIASRRIQLRRELNDIRDGAAGVASGLEYFERVLGDAVAPRDVGLFEPGSFYAPAAAPPPSAVPLAPEGAVPVSPPTGVPPVHDPNGADVPGSGIVREHYLGGFE